MTVGLAFGIVLAVASSPSATEAAPECMKEARALLDKVRDLSDKRRARVIELAVRRDARIVCGVVGQAFFAADPQPPKGCELKDPLACTALRVIPLAKAIEADIDPVAYLRIETIALRLREQKLLGDAERALLEAWLVSSALARRADKEHDH
jgi:hypothetical protein